VDKIRTSPDEAADDRGQMKEDGCLVSKKKTRSPACVYGDPDGKKTVVLFGDSHAMQWFPALNKVAKKRHWRLLGLTKSGCTPAKTTVFTGAFKRGYTECDTWRRKTLKRIEKADPALIMTTSLTSYRVMHDGDRLGRESSDKALRKGLVETF